MGSTDARGHAEVHTHAHNPEVAHEHSDISVRGVLWFVAVLAGTALVIHVGMWLLFIALDRLETSNEPFVTPLATSAGKDVTKFPQPGLQTEPWVQLRQFRIDEDAYLHSYGWIDQKAGVAHVPIDKAKDLLLQRGLPSRQGQADPREGTHVAAFGEASGGQSIPAGLPDTSPPPPAGGATAPPAPGGSTPGAAPGSSGRPPAQPPGKPGGGL
jgi:hypothetical protein